MGAREAYPPLNDLTVRRMEGAVFLANALLVPLYHNPQYKMYEDA
jgi:hypothetical protein